MSYPSTDIVTLVFRLPKAFGLIPSGRYFPCLHGCVVRVNSTEGLVTVIGPNREQALQMALRFVRVHARGGLKIDDIPVSIAGGGYAGGKDSGHIVVGHQVTFAYGAVVPMVEREGAA